MTSTIFTAQGLTKIYTSGEVQVVAEYIGAHSPVDPQVEGRIKGQ